jgi:hypothetical protein
MRYRLVLKRQASQGRWQKWTEKTGPILLRPWRGSEAVPLHSSATGRSHHPLARKPCSVLNNYKYFRPFAQRFPFNFISKSSYAIQTSLEPDGWVEQRTRGLMACVCNSKAGKQIVAAKRTAQTCEICQLPDWYRGNGIVIRQPVYELGKQIQQEYAFSLLFAGVPLRSGVLELSSDFYPLLSILFAVSSSWFIHVLSLVNSAALLCRRVKICCESSTWHFFLSCSYGPLCLATDKNVILTLNDTLSIAYA